MTDAPPLHVLYIDDSLADQEFLRTAFRHAFPHVRVTSVTDAAGAMRALQSGGKQPRDFPDLILLDIKMPGKDGHEFLRELRRDPLLRRLPVVMLTSSRLHEDILRAYDDGANAYIPKPADALGYGPIARELHQFWTHVSMLPGGERS